ncbi:hypothetical protein SNK03_008055 [Fusarium graminearum]
MPRIIAAFVVVVLNHQEPLNNKLLSFIIIIYASKTVSIVRGVGVIVFKGIGIDVLRVSMKTASIVAFLFLVA